MDISLADIIAYLSKLLALYYIICYEDFGGVPGVHVKFISTVSVPLTKFCTMMTVHAKL